MPLETVPPEILQAVSGSPIASHILAIGAALFILERLWLNIRNMRRKDPRLVLAEALTELSSTLQAMKSENEKDHVYQRMRQETHKDALERIEKASKKAHDRIEDMFRERIPTL